MSPDSPGEEKEADSFYSSILSKAEQMRLPLARQVDGLDEEIALLRVRIARMAQEQPEKLDLLLRGIRLLVQAVSTRYRLSQKAKDDLSENIAGVLRGIGMALWPEERNGH